jgi:undecaprenyl diphosphate synthase
MDTTRLPRHIAIIMDGNGRWAKQRGLPRVMGHRAGVKAVRTVVETSVRLGVEVLTLYAFSHENWSRPKKELNTLMRLLDEFLAKERANLHKNNIRLISIGRTSRLPEFVRRRLSKIIEETRQNSGLILNLALSYGGRQEIIDAVKAIALKVQEGGYSIDQIDEELFGK